MKTEKLTSCKQFVINSVHCRDVGMSTLDLNIKVHKKNTGWKNICVEKYSISTVCNGFTRICSKVTGDWLETYSIF